MWGLTANVPLLAVLATIAVALGIVALIKGGDWTVAGAVGVAKRAQLSNMFIGATIIGFGTSVPELFTSLNAHLQGQPGISLGNVVGSNIANMLLVVGVSALFGPLLVKRAAVSADIVMMLAASAALVAGIVIGGFSRFAGLAMVAALIAFVVRQYRACAISGDDVSDVEDVSTAQLVPMLAGGFIALAVGAELVVKGAVALGTLFGVPPAIIGLTVVAVGTSLPELAAAAAAAARRETDLIIGNIIGSNTFNILLIIGLTAAVKPLPVDPSLAGPLVLWAFVLTSTGFAVWLLAERAFNKAIGAGMLAAYAALVIGSYLMGPAPTPEATGQELAADPQQFAQPEAASERATGPTDPAR